MIFLGIIVGFTVFKDANSKFQIMHCTNNFLFGLLAYISFLTNLAIAFGTFSIMQTQPDAFSIFAGYAALLGIISLDNQIANWVHMFIPNNLDEDFMQIEFC